MGRVLATVGMLALSAASAIAQVESAPKRAAPKTAPPVLVEFEMMTWPEVKAALEAGKTTALVYTGGTATGTAAGTGSLLGGGTP